jgi:hypothetical protein
MERYFLTARNYVWLIALAKSYTESIKVNYPDSSENAFFLKNLHCQFKMIWDSAFTISVGSRNAVIVPLLERNNVNGLEFDNIGTRKVSLLVCAKGLMGDFISIKGKKVQDLSLASYCMQPKTLFSNIPQEVNNEKFTDSFKMQLAHYQTGDCFDTELVYLFPDQVGSELMPVSGMLSRAHFVLNSLAVPSATEPEKKPVPYKSGGEPSPKPKHTFTVTSAHDKIHDIEEYFYCFKNEPSVDYFYDVYLCISQPRPGTRETWEFSKKSTEEDGNPVFVGHTFLVLRQTRVEQPSKIEKHITRNVGFYPNGAVSPLLPVDQGCLNDDSYADFNIAVKIKTDNSHFNKILSYLSKGNKKGYLYNLNSNNCTTFALDALAFAGFSFPRTIGHWIVGGRGLNPGDLGEDIIKMKLPDNMTLITSFKEHKNAGSCPK